jgi:hypothetical protein
MRGSLRARGSSVHSLRFALNHMLMKRVLSVRRRRRSPVQSLGIRFVLSEQQLIRARAVESILAQLPVLCNLLGPIFLRRERRGD